MSTKQPLVAAFIRSAVSHSDVDAAMKDGNVRPDLVLLNPPSTGCGKQTAERIASLMTPRIVYV